LSSFNLFKFHQGPLTKGLPGVCFYYDKSVNLLTSHDSNRNTFLNKYSYERLLHYNSIVPPREKVKIRFRFFAES